jgi:enoyl-CoA hydratase/carnithine racemase
MSGPFVVLERRGDGVAVIRLDNPPANALCQALLAELADVASELTLDPPGAVVVTGNAKLFAAGADIKEFGGQPEARIMTNHFRRALDALAGLPRIVIAAVTGYCLGGGCELALACDMRVADSSAKLGQPEVLLGLIPGGGGTQRLARLVGPSRAKDILLTGRQVDAAEALRIGLVDRVTPKGTTALEGALELAGELAQGPLQAHALMKRAVDAGLETSLADGISLEQDLFVDVFGTADATTGVKSFLEHGPGKATFAGR